MKSSVDRNDNHTFKMFVSFYVWLNTDKPDDREPSFSQHNNNYNNK